MNKKMITGVALTLLAVAGASAVFASASDAKVKNNSLDNNKKDKSQLVVYDKKEDIPAIKTALKEFKSIEDFNKQFLDIKPEQWLIASTEAKDNGKTQDWLIYASKDDAIKQGVDEKTANTGAACADIKEALIVRETNQQITNEKNLGMERLAYTNGTHQITGEKQDVKVDSWEIENDNAGNQVLKVAFTFENKTDKEVNLEQFAKDRIKLGQMVDHKTNKALKLDTSALKGQTVLKQGKVSGIVYGQLLDNTQKNSFTFGMTRKKGVDFTGGLTLNF
jgi:hypothetical protein